MKDKLIISISILSIIAVTLSLILINKEDSRTSANPFYLEDKYYENNNFTEINSDEINKLIANQESFVVFVYQPMCITSADFEVVLNTFREKKHINIYKIAFSSIKGTENFKYLEYYPSFIIFNKGKMVDFLQSDKDEDLKRYQELTAFTDWFTTYVKLKENSSNQETNSENSNNQENNNDQTTSNTQEENNQQNNATQTNDNQSDKDAEKMAALKEKVLQDANITKEKNKVNIYLFWGSGCPHCAAEQAFFNKIEKEYGSFYNLYKFETWGSSVNRELLQDFAKAMGDDNVTGVPYTIIGEKTFKGFNEDFKEPFMEAIKEQASKNFDVYFDKINNIEDKK